MKQEKIEYHWNSISYDIFEIWIWVWNILQKVKNKIKKLIIEK